jgi:DNA-binding MarR family transcriptional regulator
MQVSSESDIAGLLDRLIDDALPGRRGVGAWRALLRAHIILMRRLGADLEEKTGLTLGEFDVIAQLAEAGGELRMTELSDLVHMSPSAMTRRVSRLVESGLVCRSTAEGDARGVVVGLTQPGVARLIEAVPIHLREVSKLFLEQLDDQELDVLERALDKVTIDSRSG